MIRPELIAFLFGLLILLILFFILSLLYDRQLRLQKVKDDWPFGNWNEKVYELCFGNKTPETMIRYTGVRLSEYLSDCRVAGKEADLTRLCVHYVYGNVLGITGLLLGLFSSLLFAFAGVFLYCYFCLIEVRLVRKQAENKRKQIEMELPRFLDLLRTELNVGLPIEKAIYVICERTDTLLSREFFLALRKMEFGASEWGDAMEMIAAKYNVDALSSFVLHVVTAYRKGVSVANAVEREYREIHKTMVLNVRDRAEKTKTAALLPMFLLHLLPMIAFISLPLVVTLLEYM